MRGSEPSQTASKALEMVLKKLEDSLHSDSPPLGRKPPFLEGAMVFLHGHTPRE
jgi:hypothetical protein